MITMFQVNHREDPLPESLLQHVLNEGQRIAVILRLSIQASVVDHQPPFPGHILGDNEAGGGPLGVTGVQSTWVNELHENLHHGLFPPALEGELPVPIHTGVWLQSYLRLTVWSTNWRREHRFSTEEGITILVLQPVPQCLDLGALIELRLGFARHLDH